MPRNTPNKISLKKIAAIANVSTMTVSRVLNGSPKVAPATRQRILEAAKTTGYRPDPQMARLMSLVRDRKQQKIRATIAVVRDQMPDPHYRFVALEAIKSRATQYGYATEEFFLGSRGITPARLQKILSTRGIEGIIASPSPKARHLLEFDFRPYASVTFGYGLRELNLHRVSTYVSRGMMQALDTLRDKGYHRIGLALTDWVDLRADYAYSGTLLNFHQNIPAEQRIPHLSLPNTRMEKGKSQFLEWMQAFRPDAVVSFDSLIPDWIEKDLGLSIPKDIGFVTFDRAPSAGRFAGIDHRREVVAKAAVDLIANQLMHNETGIPEVPHHILIPAAFAQGPSME
jgi:LacI family transcriptional regulator